MNLVELQAVCAAYHGVGVQDLIEGPVNLFLVAANNVRKKLEKKHDFECCRCTATLPIDTVSGGSLDNAVILPPDTDRFSGMRIVTDINGLRQGGDLIPLDFTSTDSAIERERYELELSDDLAYYNRYPSDAQYLAGFGQSTLAIRGRTIYAYPRTPLAITGQTSDVLTVYIDGYGWLVDYTKDDLIDETAESKDFFIAHGFEYLQWKIIDELNQKFQTYVARQEGNVGPPTQKIADALNDLIVEDSYAVDAHTTRSRG